MNADDVAKWTETRPRTSSAKSKLWKRLTRSINRGAAEHIDFRRFRQRVKGVFAREYSQSLHTSHKLNNDLGHSGPRSHEQQGASPRSRWLQPLKRVWKRKTYVRLPSVVSSSTSLDKSARKQPVQTRQKSPPALGTVVLRKRSSREASPRDTLIDDTNTTTDARHESRLRFNGPSSRTLPSKPSTLKCHYALHKARSAPCYSGIERRDSHDALVLLAPSISVPADPASPSPHPSTESCQTLTHTNDQAEPSTSTTSSDRAEYERLMKVCFKAPARRTPIPSPWRLPTQQIYASRGPTSLYRKVATNPMASSHKALYSRAAAFATEPRRPKSKFSQPLSAKPESPLRAIAARRATTIQRPACFAVEKSYRRRVILVYPTLPMRRRDGTGMNEQRRFGSSRTLPRDWTLRVSEAQTLSANTASTSSESVVADMASMSLDAAEDSACDADEQEEDASLQRLSMMSCEDDDTLSLPTTEDHDGATSDDDVWYDVPENPLFEETSNEF